MPPWHDAFWARSATEVPRRERRSGTYRTFTPPLLVGSPLALPAETDALLAGVEQSVRQVTAESSDLTGISRFLLRSEAIASSRIEGIAPSARQVALAELGQTQSVRGLSEQAQMVANNMTVVREATTRLVNQPTLTALDIIELHRALLPAEPRHHGLRTQQNWIGGSDWHPLDADFVPPAPQQVGALLDDLVQYMNGAAHSAIAQAAIAHAQFETIHPFTDGNGRLGRALIHTVFARRGFGSDAVLPISLVLSTLREQYVEGLTAFRSDETETSAVMAAWARWVHTFAEVTLEACHHARRIAAELATVRSEWDEQLRMLRTARGMRPTPRGGSAVALVLAQLPATPVLTPSTVQRIHQVSHVAAGNALDELHDAGILTTRNVSPERRAFIAPAVLDTITWAERGLASTRFDTRLSPPRGGVPAPPERPRP